ncbi:anti-sigma factor family protein [Tepidibacillus sp. LV47]|uniref:anti-sigma factor family protein n=1 Tax=Tepidibacillus sp. LV47 TaxID=3398228 RepID=UPI003AACE369
MNHPEEERISAYVDGELTESEKSIMEEHLQVCDRCQNLFQELTEIKNLVFYAYQNIEVPQAIEQQVMTKIELTKMENLFAINKIPWFQVVLPVLLVALLLTSQPLFLSFGIFSSIMKVIFSIIPVIVTIVPYLLGVIVMISLFAIFLSLWLLRRFIVSKVIQ